MECDGFMFIEGLTMAPLGHFILPFLNNLMPQSYFGCAYSLSYHFLEPFYLTF
jgi:hypothetical protein